MHINYRTELEALEELTQEPSEGFDPSAQLFKGDFIHKMNGGTKPENVIGEIAIRLGALKDAENRDGFEEYLGIIFNNADATDSDNPPARQDDTILSVAITAFDERVFDRWNGMYSRLMDDVRDFGAVLVSGFQEGKVIDLRARMPDSSAELPNAANL